MRRTVVPIAVCAAVAAAWAGPTASGAPSAAAPAIAITGTAVKGGVVTVTVKIANWRLLPARFGKKPNTAGGGHWHLLVDDKYATASAGPAARTRRLTVGSHTIRAELANNDHSSLAPRALSAVVTVRVTTSSGGVAVPEQGGTAGGDTGAATGGGSVGDSVGNGGTGGY